MLTAAQPGGALSTVRAALLQLSADPASHAAAYAKIMGRGTHPFGASGFPKPPPGGHVVTVVLGLG